MWLLILCCLVIAGIAFAADRFLARHPLRKLDEKTEKYRYRGF